MSTGLFERVSKAQGASLSDVRKGFASTAMKLAHDALFKLAPDLPKGAYGYALRHVFGLMARAIANKWRVDPNFNPTSVTSYTDLGVTDQMVKDAIKEGMEEYSAVKSIERKYDKALAALEEKQGV